MSSKLLRISQCIILVLIGAFAWGAISKVVSSLFSFAGGEATLASAATLTVQPASPLTPVDSGFTYQGQLLSGGNPANGQYDFRFTLWDDPSAGTLVAGPITYTNQTVTNGLFTLQLDFGMEPFTGQALYLQIGARLTGGPVFTPLLLRQPITPAPYALFAQDVPAYDNVVAVAKSGGDFTTIGAAITSITDNGPANRYLVWVGPGVYSETVQMKPFVDI